MDRSIIAQLRAGGTQLKDYSVTPYLDSELLLGYVLTLTREQLILRYNDEITDVKIADFHKLLTLRESYSVAAITGEKEFWKYSFTVNKDVLIPRPDTETMIVALLLRYRKSKQALKIVELGTGSGCVIISMLNEFKNAVGFGFEKSNAAFRVTMRNVQRHRLGSRLKIYKLDFNNAAKVLPCKVDIIVSNPPYIRRSAIPHLQTEVKNEPRMALDGGFNGVLSYFSILKLAKKILRPGGEIFLEVGSDWKDSILPQSSTFKVIDKYRDLSGYERVLILK